MTVFVSLLRGINVGGRTLIRMDRLRAVYESLGLAAVRTHLQSGNAVFREEGTDTAQLKVKLEDAIEGSVGFRPAVLVRTAAELAQAVARNPFPQQGEADPSHLLVMFLAETPDAAASHRLAEAMFGREAFRLSGRELYLHYPDGIGRSKLTNAVIEKRLETVGTARNWNTVTKLLEMTEALEGALARRPQSG
jgi:uncharacterized protein (DUF1697 family)